MTWTTSIIVTLAFLLLLGFLDAADHRAERMERAAALCIPAHTEEIAHTSMEPNGSLRCAVTRQGRIVTRMEIES